MDLRKMLSTVEFTEARRGADRNEVASFLREVARGVAALERQAAEATARADQAEQRVRDTGGDDELRRALVLAQRTADAAVADAREEADRVVTAAEERATRIVAEAQAEAEGVRAESAARSSMSTDELIAEAEAEVRTASDALRTHLQQENLILAERRARLLEDVTSLESHTAAQRHRLESTITTLQFIVDSPEGLAAIEAPPTSALEALAAMEAADAAAGNGSASTAVVDLSEVAAGFSPPDPGTQLEMAGAQAEVSIDEPEIQLIDEHALEWGTSDVSVSEPITAEVPVVAAAPQTAVIDVRDEVITEADMGMSGGTDRRWRFGKRD